MGVEIDHDELIREFKESGQLPLNWQWTARSLVCAANTLQAKREEQDAAGVLKPDPLWNLQRPMLLLYGLPSSGEPSQSPTGSEGSRRDLNRRPESPAKDSRRLELVAASLPTGR